jgi:hypothetical protein
MLQLEELEPRCLLDAALAAVFAQTVIPAAEIQVAQLAARVTQLAEISVAGAFSLAVQIGPQAVANLEAALPHLWSTFMTQIEGAWASYMAEIDGMIMQIAALPHIPGQESWVPLPLPPFFVSSAI